MTAVGPTLQDIAATRAAIAAAVAVTPIHHWRGPGIAQRVAPGTQVIVKFELLQETGSFKARGAIAAAQQLTAEERARGITALSAGNHAIAASWAARSVGSHARIVMPRTASPVRVARAEAYGGQIVLVDDVVQGIAEMERLIAEEGRVLLHAFENPFTIRGTGTLGLEMLEQAGHLDAVIVAIGGGGLSAGVAAAIKQAAPQTLVIGVEPTGADGMRQSFAAGRAIPTLPRPATIADSLAPPFTLPLTYAVNRHYLDDLITITDQQMAEAQALILDELKAMVEPACAAGTAALIGPLRERLAGQRVGVLLCGSNTDRATFDRHQALLTEAAA
ncbi:MAG: threonine/serine dehydratase [Alphaproteobacteria bacterium]|nr:MAG: threonine/serine dehydratase [Alphaproteobacteria bacterium]